MPEDKKYRLDKTAFKAQSFEEADDQITDMKDKTLAERLAAGMQLINQVYGTTTSTKMDRTVFSMRKHAIR